MIFISEESEINLNLNNRAALYFYAQWMPFHKKMLKMIEKIELRYKKNKIAFYAVDVEQFKSLCKRYSVESIPTVVIFRDCCEVKKIEGLVMTAAFRNAFIDI